MVQAEQPGQKLVDDADAGPESRAAPSVSLDGTPFDAIVDTTADTLQVSTIAPVHRDFLDDSEDDGYKPILVGKYNREMRKRRDQWRARLGDPTVSHHRRALWTCRDNPLLAFAELTGSVNSRFRRRILQMEIQSNRAAQTHKKKGRLAS